ncbi:MAG: hypothetical protein JWM80_3370, partial [Cyanobacteria bacterium RYN_339]|nr:hypothetical protein [Cyanobacteria bacterium RYN_339]
MFLRRLPVLVLVLGMAIALAPFVGQAMVNSDELDELANAWRQLHGQVIYRDYFEFVPPLPQWLAAGLFALGGPGVVWPRVLQALALVLAGLAQYGTARLAGVRPWLAVLPGLVLATALFPQFPVYYHHWLALAFISGAVWCAARGLQAGKLPYSAIAGALLGLAGLCTQTDGVLVAVAMGLTLVGQPRGRDHLVAAVAGCLVPLGLA